MNDDELRARLARLDPQAGASFAPIPDELKERTMTTTLETDTAPARDRRPRRLVAAAAVVAVAAGGTAYALLQDDDPAPTKAPTVLALTAVPVDPAAAVAANCLPVAEVLPSATLAFAGTVVATDGAQTTLDVTRWFRGGTADQVTVAQSADPTARTSEDAPVDFALGGSYLIASEGGLVGGACSPSGPDSPELRALFDRTFG